MNTPQTKGFIYARLALRSFQAAIVLWVGWAMFSTLPDITTGELTVVFSAYCAFLAFLAAWEWKWGPSSTTIYVIEMDEQGFRSGRRGQGPVVPWSDVTEILWVGRVLALGPVSRYFFDGELILYNQSGKQHTLHFGQCSAPRATYKAVIVHLCRANPRFHDAQFEAALLQVADQFQSESDILRSLHSNDAQKADQQDLKPVVGPILWEFVKQILLPLAAAFALAMLLLKTSRLGPDLTWDLILLATIVFGYMILDIRLPKFLRSVDLLILAFFSRPGKTSPIV